MSAILRLLFFFFLFFSFLFFFFLFLFFFSPYRTDASHRAACSYVNALFEKDDVSKAQFFKGLPRVLPMLPKRVIEQRVSPGASAGLPRYLF